MGIALACAERRATFDSQFVETVTDPAFTTDEERMIDPRFSRGAVVSLKWALVGCRGLAYQKAPHAVLAEVLDALEILPIYLDCPEDRTSEFKDALVELAERGGAFGMALEAFEGRVGY